MANTTSSPYSLAKVYAGSSFFEGWNYYNKYDNLTNGDVTYVGASNASSVAFVNPAGNAILKVDNTTNVLYEQKRNSVRLQSNVAYGVGSVFVFDAVHMPYGCSVWPSFWTAGTNWPDNGEIDIVEGVNTQSANQMAIHTGNHTDSTNICQKATTATQSGKNGPTDCSLTAGTGGCTVMDSRTTSYGAAFAQNGGGLFATQFDTSGVFIWFWERANIPAGLTTASNATGVDPSTWGTPAAAYPSGDNCNTAQRFGPQTLVLDITLCGDWAGAPAIYNQTTCYSTQAPNQGICYNDNVIGTGANYANAYFEIPSIRVFTAPNTTTTSSNAGGSGASGSSGSGNPSSTSGSPNTASPAPKGNGAATFGKSAIGSALLALLIGAAIGF